MSPASWPRDDAGADRLLVVDPQSGVYAHDRVGHLPGWLNPRDVVVINDAATLPAMLATLHPELAEVRVAAMLPPQGAWLVLMGRGSWRTPTEKRPPPPQVVPGFSLQISSGLSFTVEEISGVSARLVRGRFSVGGPALWHALYAAGRPVQYAYTRAELTLWHVNTVYAGRPWAVEMPSAGRAMTWGNLTALQQRGVQVATLTHAAGLSSTGDAALDAALPLPEAYEIPAPTVAAIEQARRRGGRVLAIGTSVVRALEGNAAVHGGVLVAGSGVTNHLVGPRTPMCVVHGLLSGMHEPGASHLQLMQALAPPKLLNAALEDAAAAGYLAHEFGDRTLVLPGVLPRQVLDAA